MLWDSPLFRRVAGNAAARMNAKEKELLITRGKVMISAAGVGLVQPSARLQQPALVLCSLLNGLL
jgi:hypothetical protein